jgi:hypothetical protein
VQAFDHCQVSAAAAAATWELNDMLVLVVAALPQQAGDGALCGHPARGAPAAVGGTEAGQVPVSFPSLHFDSIRVRTPSLSVCTCDGKKNLTRDSSSILDLTCIHRTLQRTVGIARSIGRIIGWEPYALGLELHQSINEESQLSVPVLNVLPESFTPVLNSLNGPPVQIGVSSLRAV